jgi:hypothetical protein
MENEKEWKKYIFEKEGNKRERYKGWGKGMK